MSTTHSQILGTTSTQIFLAVATCAFAWAVFGVDYSPLKRIRVVMDDTTAPKALGSVSSNQIEIIHAESKAELAPADPEALNPTTTEGYIAKYSDIARAEMERYGIPASISMAQALIESRAGTSLLAQKCKNHFGIKCWSKAHRGCCMMFKDDSNHDSFRHFENSPSESWRAHSKLLSSGRYEKLHAYGNDYRQWAYGLKAAGYATDKKYAEKLIGIIERYDLHELDQ